MNMMEGLVPIALFLCITTGVLATLYMSAKVKADQQETLRQVISSGQKLDETTLKLMVKSPNSPEMDLRSGLVSLMMGLGFCAAGGVAYLNGFDQHFGTILALIGIVVGFTGAGQILSWRLRRPASASEPQ